MHRLLVKTEMLQQEAVTLSGEAARHLKVVRPRPEEILELFDGEGHTRTYAYRGGVLGATAPCVTHPRLGVGLTLFACVTKGSRWDWTIEKAVELGATRIVPVLSDRAIVRLAPAERPAKAERWRRIAEDAARQSDAVWLPEILEAVDFPKALALVKGTGRVYVGALTNPPPPLLLEALEKATPEPVDSWGMFVGPEGDFTPDELAALLACAEPVSFGSTILRAETAAIYGLSVLAAFAQRMRKGCV